MEMTKMIRKISMVGVCMALAGAAQASLITVDFTSAEGFTAGALNGKQGWVAGVGWNLDPSGDGKVTGSLINRVACYAAEAVKMSSGQSLTFRTDLKFMGDNIVNPGSAQDIFTLGVKLAADTSAATTANGTLTTFRTTTAGVTSFGGTQIGNLSTNGVGNNANLAVEYTLTVGATAAESTYGWKFTNLDTSWSVSGSEAMTTVIFDALTTGDGVYSYFNSRTFSSNSSGITGIDVYSTTVIPEPATIGMLGLGALITLLIRRMKQ